MLKRSIQLLTLVMSLTLLAACGDEDDGGGNGGGGGGSQQSASCCLNTALYSCSSSDAANACFQNGDTSGCSRQAANDSSCQSEE